MVIAMVLVMVVVFIVGVAMVAILGQKALFEGADGHPRKYSECFAVGAAQNQVSSQMLASGADPYAVRRFSSALAAFDPYEWSHAPRAPVTLVGPVGDGWKKNMTMHLSGVAYSLLDEALSFPQAVFVFGAQNFGGELYVLPIEMMTAPEVVFDRESHRELLETQLRWLAPARMVSAVVPPKKTVVFELENGSEVVAKQGMHAALAITAPIVRIVIKSAP